MTNLAERDGRQRTLFLSNLYPSFFGTGSQIRAAALVRMLAEREDVHLLVVYPHEKNRGTRDVELESLCRKVEFIPFRMGGVSAEPASAPAGAVESGPRVLPQAELNGAIRRFYDEHGLNSLFVFRLESCFFLKGHLDSFPRRFLDLDESAWRRIDMLDRIKTISSASTPETSDRRLQVALRMMEREMIPRFQKIFVSSETEKAEVGRLSDFAPIHVLPNIFSHRPSLPPPPASQVREIFFVGLFSHFPNVDAVLYFHREIFPLIQKKLAAPVIFRVVGSPCSGPLLEIGRDPNVRLMGYQADLEPFYASASVAVVPLRAGAGTRIKILEAFVYGRPVVSTTIGATGLAVTHGADILLADEPEAFAEACVQILESPALAARLVENGARLHRERYSPEILQRRYDEVVRG
jgi:glycosyltransferase involved in cell wall biosynthesis